MYSGDTFELGGSTFSVTLVHDDSHGAPWEVLDGHGVVSGWERAYETPRGCWVLSSDQHASQFYNWFETMAIAKRDEWGLAPDRVAALAKRLKREPTKRDIRKAAVQADFDYLRGWCDGDWSYVGVIVELLDSDGEGTGVTESLWGVESFGGYHDIVARELAEEMLSTMGDAKDSAIAELGA